MKIRFRARPEKRNDSEKTERAYRAMLVERELQNKNWKWVFPQRRFFW